MRQSWEQHYKKEKSLLNYPDENLVRMLSKHLKACNDITHIDVLDLGCGTGRHLKLLNEFSITNSFGADYSFNALLSCKNSGFTKLINCNNEQLPFKNSSFDIVISWGSLHYCYKDTIGQMISEIHRVLKPEGRILATLRKDSDTYLKKGTHLGNDTWQTELGDLKGSVVSFFSERELQQIFKIFGKFNYGWMARSIIGDTSQIIAHWIIDAQK